MPEAGPWCGRELTGLTRSGAVLDRVGVAGTPAGRVTELKVLGDTATDVHLVLGEDGMTPGQVLGAAVEVLERRSPAVPGHALPYGEVGPGLSVVRKLSREPAPPTLHVLVPAFGLRADHDLTASPGVFGLTTARDRTRGHFPGISASPLAVGSAGQSVTARFGADGFHAAAVTAITAVAGAPPPLRWRTTQVRATFDRPFGFLAVHRPTRLVLAAGWVEEPERHREDEDLTG
ncbi:serpin family protein [Streptomyces sp. NPDC052302]|uniref:serpin family protein n=1 Tax=unclassified Streptomyces TaxID=2593676 RepID=UPI0037D98EFE